VKLTPLIGTILVILAASGIAIATLAGVDGTLTGDWIDANAPVGYPADGFILLGLAGLGVLVFLAAAVLFLAALVARSRRTGPTSSTTRATEG
jgi:hypothetical protein